MLARVGEGDLSRYHVFISHILPNVPNCILYLLLSPYLKTDDDILLRVN